MNMKKGFRRLTWLLSVLGAIPLYYLFSGLLQFSLFEIDFFDGILGKNPELEPLLNCSIVALFSLMVSLFCFWDIYLVISWVVAGFTSKQKWQ